MKIKLMLAVFFFLFFVSCSDEEMKSYSASVEREKKETEEFSKTFKVKQLVDSENDSHPGRFFVVSYSNQNYLLFYDGNNSTMVPLNTKE